MRRYYAIKTRPVFSAINTEARLQRVTELNCRDKDRAVLFLSLPLSRAKMFSIIIRSLKFFYLAFVGLVHDLNYCYPNFQFPHLFLYHVTLSLPGEITLAFIINYNLLFF